MPFENHGNRAFTESSILKNAPAASGVYGLSNARAWIFVGESDNMQGRLLAHLRGADAPLARTATGFTFELSRPADRTGRRNRLILELDPLRNRESDAMRDAGE